MKRKKWELVIDGKLADRFELYDIDAHFRAQQLSANAPMLTVQLYEIGPIGAVLDSTWREARKVKQ